MAQHHHSVQQNTGAGELASVSLHGSSSKEARHGSSCVMEQHGEQQQQFRSSSGVRGRSREADVPLRPLVLCLLSCVLARVLSVLEVVDDGAPPGHDRLTWRSAG